MIRRVFGWFERVKHGGREEEALNKGLASVGWEELGDLSKLTKREELTEMAKHTYPSEE